MPYSRAWCVGERQGSLHQLIESYKFERAKAAYIALVDLLDETIPFLPDNTVVTSVPTIRPHIRKRGYDHVGLVAQEFARRRKLPFQRLLIRADTSVQLGASKAVRHEQAAKAYQAIPRQLENVLLIDDVLTTGATALFAAKALREAGSENVFFAVLARQPLEKREKY